MADWFSGFGVALILAAFLGSAIGKIGNQSLVYWLLNIAGGVLATIGAMLLKSIPFVVLETTWIITSLVGLLKYLKQKTLSHGK
jgi:uncharacterized membrane protein